MNVLELRDALDKMVANGHGDAVVAHVNGQGKVSRVLGWELTLDGVYEPRRGASQNPVPKKLKLLTVARF